MPLIKKPSKRALQKNIATEMEAHPSPEKRAQNLAVAYSVQKQARKKKMADGGEVSAHDEKRPMPDDLHHDAQDEHRANQKKPLHKAGWTDDTWSDQASHSFSKAPHEAEETNFENEGHPSADNADDENEFHMEMGHSTDPLHIDEDHDEDIADARLAHGGSVAERIMHRRKMAEGGQVDIQDNGDEDPEMYTDLNMKKELYDDSQLEHQPEDSNEHGHTLSDEDENDHIDRIRLKLRQKRGF